MLVNGVPMREQGTAKLTLNSVFDILKLIPLFTVASQKKNLSNVVNYNAYFLTSATYCKICKKNKKKTYPFRIKIACFLPKMMTALRTAQLEKSTLSHSFFVHASVHNSVTRKRPPGGGLFRRSFKVQNIPFFA